MIGSSNRFSHAAALAVAEAPGQAYNPLLIHGGTGLGKTHLLQAIGQYVRAQHPNLRRRATSPPRRSRTSSSRPSATSGSTPFKQRYRARYDVLLVDDVQFLGGKERIQEEFFHTFNTLYEAGKQVVLTCDRPVREMGGLEQRLRSRFEWGLTTDVQPPDLETRLAILSKRVDADRVRIADGEVLDAIARRVVANIRELEGALTRVVAYASLTGRPITAELVRETLHDLSGDPTRGHRRRHPGRRRRGLRRLGRRHPLGPAVAAVRSTRGRSRCTSRASSPTARCRASATASAAITRPCCTPCGA